MITSILLTTLIASTSPCDIKKSCTREFAPVTCTYQGETIKGSNSCMATVAAEQAACEAGKTFQPAQLKCDSKAMKPIKPVKPVKKQTVNVKIKKVDCNTAKFCTMDYAPRTCNYEGRLVKGTNLCATKVKVEKIACSKGLEGQTIKMDCDKPKSNNLILK